MEISKNDILKIKITDLTSEGMGVGKIDNFAIFVPNCAIDDELEIKIIKSKKNYAVGRIDKILNPSDSRINPDCSSYLQCGGCVFRHISYEAELKAKQKKVEDAIAKIGGFKDIEVSKIIKSEDYNNYRNKAQLPISKDENGNYYVGFFAARSHRVVKCEDCLLQPKVFNLAIDAFLNWANIVKPSVYSEINHSGLLRHLYLRYAEKTGEVMVCLVINGEEIPNQDLLCNLLIDAVPNLKSIMINYNKEKTNVILGKKVKVLWGRDYIVDVLCGLKFYISALSFYQVNRTQAEKLYNIVKDYANVQKDEVLLDLYCGTGTIGLTMASFCKKLIGIEIVKPAIENAKENSRLNNISNAEFICADASKAAEFISEKKEFPDVVILDPPRKGCEYSLIDNVANLKPSRIVYVSCDAATLARDLKIFNENGYLLKKVTPVDMFPRTSCFEMRG